MPIYEFRCSQCGCIQEFLMTSSSEQTEIKCKECQGEELERVLSTVSYSMGGASGAKDASPNATTKTCGPGSSCTTINLPGYSR